MRKLLFIGVCLLAAQSGPRAAGAVVVSQLGYAPSDTMSAVLAVTAGSVVTPSFRTTATDGKALDYSNAAPSGSAFTCHVDSVTKAGWTVGAHKQLSSTVTVP